MNSNLVIRRTPLTALAAGAMIVFTACGGQSAGDAALELIAGDLTEQLDLGELDATCNEPDSEEAGETFTCSATTESGDVVEFVGSMVADDEIVMGASNVLLAEDFEVLEADATEVVAANFEVEPTSVSVVCPDETTILNDDQQASCEITDAADGATYELIVNMLPFSAGEGFSGAEYEVGEQIS
ncbi:MAG: hypothetical protein WA964_00290 [Ilumatobacter sp.]|uniref:hypothetical protein n=1 Tax=Ilumatobacter sp. TaxID=1967498 RepID=UPI003C73FE00